MNRFYVLPECVSDGIIIIRGREAHHARDVMRLKAGDQIEVFDGTGKQYAGTVVRVDKEDLTVKIDKIFEKGPVNFRLALAQGIPKLNRMDAIIEKATELGVERIIPVITERTVVKVGAKGSPAKLARWKKLAIAAAKQCGRVTIPEIEPISRFNDALSWTSGYELAIIPCLCGETQDLKSALKSNTAKSTIVFIGPEGDFTKEEVEEAVAKGAKPVSLGREVLRSDTAAIAALSIVNYELRW